MDPFPTRKGTTGRLKTGRSTRGPRRDEGRMPTTGRSGFPSGPRLTPGDPPSSHAVPGRPAGRVGTGPPGNFSGISGRKDSRIRPLEIEGLAAPPLTAG